VRPPDALVAADATPPLALPRAPARARPAGAWLRRTIVAAFFAGIPLDVTIARLVGSTSLVLGAPLALAAAWTVLSRFRVRPVNGALLALSAFGAWGAASTLWVFGPDPTLAGLTYAQLTVFVWLSWQLLGTRKDLDAALAGFLVGCGAVAVGTWSAYLGGRTWSGEAWEGEARYAREGYDPNDMAVTLAVAIPIAIYFAVTGRRSWSRIVLAYVPLAGSAIALSGSRAGTLTAAFAVMIVLPWLARRSRGMLVATLLAAAISLAVVATQIPSDSWIRIFTIGDELTHGSLGDRTPLWLIALRVFGEHPLAGVGAGGFRYAAEGVVGFLTVAHNTPLEVAADFGAVGLVLFFGAVALAFRGAWRAAGDRRELCTALVLAWVVGSASLSWAAYKQTWFVLLVAAAAAARLPRASRSR
jgi:hypothetical protein